jgi:membrane protease YdiL (CAAX protease family)
VSEFSPLPLPEEPGMAWEERYPFWDYRDLAMFLGAAVVAFLAAALFAAALLQLLPPPLSHKTMLLVLGQSLGYVLLFLALYSILRVHYGRPFWEALRWIPSASITPARAVVMGFALSVGVAMLGGLLGAPEETPMKEIVLADWRSFLAVLVVGVSVGPVFEEVVFRGFMQPLFARTFGAAAGVLLAALPFGLLHLQQYGFNWQQGLLITLAGAAFGWVRHRSGSTRTAAIMHAAYNSTVFLAVLANPKELPTTW